MLIEDSAPPHSQTTLASFIGSFMDRLRTLILDLSTGDEVLDGDGLEIYIDTQWNDNHLPVKTAENW